MCTSQWCVVILKNNDKNLISNLLKRKKEINKFVARPIRSQVEELSRNYGLAANWRACVCGERYSKYTSPTPQS